MGNCNCKPREGGESVKEFLARKFHKISKKRRIDDLLTMAINESEPGTSTAGWFSEDSLEILDLEDENLFGDDLDINHVTEQNDTTAPSNRQDLHNTVTVETGIIRELQKQLREVQNELANLQRDVAREQKCVSEEHKNVRHSARLVQCQEQTVDVRHSAHSIKFQEPIEDVRHSARSIQCQELPVKVRHSANHVQCQELPVKVPHSANPVQCQEIPVKVRHSASSIQCQELPVKVRHSASPVQCQELPVKVRYSTSPVQCQELPNKVRHSASPVQCHQQIIAESMPGLESIYSYGVGDSTEQECQRSSSLQTKDDVSERNGPYLEHPDIICVNKRREHARPTVGLRSFEKGDAGVKGQQVSRSEGRGSRMMGMITEGLRTRSDIKPKRNKETTGQKLPDRKAAKLIKSAEDPSQIAEKIASLQKRDPKLPGPDKGIVWPKTMSNLSKADKAYYVEHFLRSELFRQRCLRKYQGSKTWMNGLSPFQLWVVEHEGTEEMESVLRPIPKRQNNAQAKVICWRGNTPPPPPKSP